MIKLWNKEKVNSLIRAGDYQLDLFLRCTRTFNQFAELHYTVNNPECYADKGRIYVRMINVNNEKA